jgi:hypothetical protein
VRENLAYQQLSNLQQEFQAKNDLLRSRFLEISPEDYLSTIFPDKGEEDNLVIVLGTLKDSKGNVVEKGTVTRIKFGEIWGIAWRSNTYIPYCDFKRNYYHSKTLESVRAFVNDCDGVTSTRLNKILKYLWTSLPAEPTHIVNSGKGVHFVYALDKPVKVRGLRWSINKLNETIQSTFSELIKVDKHPVVHPYRFPGFMTKINTVATVFKVREPYTFEELMELFKVTHKKEEKKEEKKVEKKAKIYVLPNGKRAFFEWVLRRLFKNPPIPGRRHNSFFALGIVAYKCKREVPYEEAIETIPMVYEDMMDRNLHIGFSIDEAYEAFHKGYKPDYVRASWRYLCGLLGWEYRPNKRNGRKREEHCAYMNCIKSAKAKFRRKEVMPMVWVMLEEGFSIRQISSMLGIPKSTLSRWIKQEELER